MTELVVNLKGKIARGLETIKDDSFLVARSDELVFRVSLDDGAKGAHGVLHHLHSSWCCAGLLTELLQEHHFVDC